MSNGQGSFLKMNRLYIIDVVLYSAHRITLGMCAGMETNTFHHCEDEDEDRDDVRTRCGCSLREKCVMLADFSPIKNVEWTHAGHR